MRVSRVLRTRLPGEEIANALTHGLGALPEILARVPLGALLWLLAGGVLYTAGVAFFSWERLRYHHTIWHLFVLGGSALHYVAVFKYLAVSPSP